MKSDEDSSNLMSNQQNTNNNDIELASEMLQPQAKREAPAAPAMSTGTSMVHNKKYIKKASPNERNYNKPIASVMEHK